MIKIRDLGQDFYEFDKNKYSIIGKRNKEKFTLGDKIKFKIMAVDLDRRTIDCVIA